MPPANSSDPLNPSRPQSIPLQVLARPPDSANLGDAGRRHSRGRSLLSGGPRPTSGHNYERLGDRSPSPPARATNRPAGALPLTLHTPTSGDEDGTLISPVGNPADFQAAMGFAGLIVPDIYLSEGSRVRTSHGSGRSIPYGSGDFDGISYYSDAEDDQNSFFPSESERIPLTDPNHLQPVSSAEPSPGGQRHDRSRSSFQSVDFDSPTPMHKDSRLGDDLQNVEAGLSPHGGWTRSRSASTAGAFSKAGSIVRAMSQRVVNLSGEAELIETSARREAAASSGVSSLGDESETSLAIFSAESRIRNKLCDLLTVLLAVESSQSVYTHPRPTQWGESPIDYALLALFVIFTLEIAARIIVSGFIFNAPEYDRANRKLGFKAAVTEKYRAAFAPQRQSSLRVPHNPVPDTLRAPTILRSFTARQGEAMRTVEEAQRLQLARRAFLRHSFNRLDFGAVCSSGWPSFWASRASNMVTIYHPPEPKEGNPIACQCMLPY
ncbi:hypothetical protein BDZ45DRAFT_754204 [Acephala macrosclerotiorum]|nr:hypothetical protein BDZ45DRAFT_754204 [Acephala macrosclerotiorum]